MTATDLQVDFLAAIDAPNVEVLAHDVRSADAEVDVIEGGSPLAEF